MAWFCISACIPSVKSSKVIKVILEKNPKDSDTAVWYLKTEFSFHFPGVNILALFPPIAIFSPSTHSCMISYWHSHDEQSAFLLWMDGFKISRFCLNVIPLECWFVIDSAAP